RHVPGDASIARELQILTQKTGSQPGIFGGNPTPNAGGLVLPPKGTAAAPPPPRLPGGRLAPKPSVQTDEQSARIIGIGAATVFAMALGCAGIGIIPLLIFIGLH